MTKTDTKYNRINCKTFYFNFKKYFVHPPTFVAVCTSTGIFLCKKKAALIGIKKRTKVALARQKLIENITELTVKLLF
jgi:hypothetical protein